MTTVDTLILGAGPAGLGCACRLHDAGVSDWLLCEQLDEAGGLSRSIVDGAGFTWDLGGHVFHGREAQYQTILHGAAGSRGMTTFRRDARILVGSAWVPYPFQRNLEHLPQQTRRRCELDLRRAEETRRHGAAPSPENFAEFLLAMYGREITEVFMRPYNEKLWAQPLITLSYEWAADSVPRPRSAASAEAVYGSETAQPAIDSWGPNSRFTYPKSGGVGSIWRSVASRLPVERMTFGARAVAVDHRERRVRFEDGGVVNYRRMVSTVPLPHLGKLIGDDELSAETAALKHSSLWVVGLGVEACVGDRLSSLCWAYFPNPTLTFYRMTHLGHYSRRLVPSSPQVSSLLVEVSDSPYRPAQPTGIADDAIQGLLECGILRSTREVVHTWAHREEYGYPVPSLGRDPVLRSVAARLGMMGIRSCGRFGSWRYEDGSMERSFLSGCDAAMLLLEESRAR